nr:ATP-binding cassette domain-containing protein [Bittarella massiliensis (ex Durand et al. 2017)]
MGTGVYGFLGPNGAGKTTFLRCMLGILPTSSGSFEYNGVPTGRKNSIAAHVGYLPQKFGVYGDLRVCEAMEYLASVHRLKIRDIDAEIDRCLALVNLADRTRSKVKALSGGMVRRLGIAQALLGDPDILVFDEPTAGLDPEERMRFKAIVEQVSPGKTVLLSTHILADVDAICDQIIIINKGHTVYTGPTADIASLARGKVFETQVMPQGGTVVGIREEAGQKWYRVVSETVPDGSIAQEPTTEDGYLCAIHLS